ncbi:hypothetical protein ACAE110713_11990 [Achromobacter aegrifaciens]
MARQARPGLQVALAHAQGGGLQGLQVAPDGQRPHQHEGAQQQAQGGIHRGHQPGADVRLGRQLDLQPLPARTGNRRHKGLLLVAHEEAAGLHHGALVLGGAVAFGVDHLERQAVVRRQRVAHVRLALGWRHAAQFLHQAVDLAPHRFARVGVADGFEEVVGGSVHDFVGNDEAHRQHHEQPQDKLKHHRSRAPWARTDSPCPTRS